MNIKIFAFLLLFAACALAAEAEDNKDCKCFEEFEPEKEGDNTICRGKKNSRIFRCGEEKPPLCKCKAKDKEIILDLGETSCLSSDVEFDDINCEPKHEWESYLNDHPHRRLFH